MIFKNNVFIEKNHNGSLTLSNDKQKMTYYGYSLKECLTEFKRGILK